MRRALVIAGVAVVVAIGAGVGIAAASIPGPDGTIHACYRSDDLGSGALYVIDSEDTCPSGFTALDWDQTAPSGLQGYEVIQEPFQVDGPIGAGTIDVTVDCPSGKVALGGGGLADATASQPTSDGSGWALTISHPAVGSGSVYASSGSVTCATEGT
jgi:hypothetical protein